jgi:hypothetical protein
MVKQFDHPIGESHFTGPFIDFMAFWCVADLEKRSAWMERLKLSTVRCIGSRSQLIVYTRNK